MACYHFVLSWMSTATRGHPSPRDGPAQSAMHQKMTMLLGPKGGGPVVQKVSFEMQSVRREPLLFSQSNPVGIETGWGSPPTLPPMTGQGISLSVTVHRVEKAKVSSRADTGQNSRRAFSFLSPACICSSRLALLFASTEQRPSGHCVSQPRRQMPQTPL